MFRVLILLVPLLLLGSFHTPAASADCVSCQPDQTCGDPIYSGWAGCYIFQQDGEWWCNMQGTCEPTDADLLVTTTGIGRVQSDNVILGPEDGQFVTSCSGFLVADAATEENRSWEALAI